MQDDCKWNFYEQLNQSHPTMVGVHWVPVNFPPGYTEQSGKTSDKIELEHKNWRTLEASCVGWLSVCLLGIYHSLVMIFKMKKAVKPLYFAAKFNKKFKRIKRMSTGNGIKQEQRRRKNYKTSHLELFVPGMSFPGILRLLKTLKSSKRKWKTGRRIMLL